MTSDGNALLATILNEPADDTARLVYADFLQENGEEDRAEFVRVQVELSTFDPHYYLSYDNRAMCERSAVPLVKRSAELLHAAWSPELCELADATGCSPVAFNGWGFRRGFVSDASMTADDFDRCAAVAFARYPIERVTLSDKEPAQTGAFPERWTWFGPHPTHRYETDRARLTGELWAALPHADYPTQKAALDALARACVLVGTKRAKRPYRPSLREQIEHAARRGGIVPRGDLAEWVNVPGDVGTWVMPHACGDELAFAYRVATGDVAIDDAPMRTVYLARHKFVCGERRVPVHVGRCDRCKVTYLSAPSA